MHACAGLPELLLGQRIVAHPALDPAARLALFRSCHTLARLVLLHATSSKRVTHHVSGGASSDTGSDTDSSESSDGSDSSIGGDALQWSPVVLAHLLTTKWQPLPACLDLELRVEAARGLDGTPQLPLHPPPTSITHHVSRLHLNLLRLSAAALAAWQLHDPARWPHLQHLTLHDCKMQWDAGAATPPPIPGLQSVSLQLYGRWRWRSNNTKVLPLAAHAARARLTGEYVAADRASLVMEHLARLTHLRVDGSVEGRAAVLALLRHPTLEHVEVGRLRLDRSDLSRAPCRWRTLTLWGGVYVQDVALLPTAVLELLTIKGFIGVSGQRPDPAACAAGVAALQRLHSQGRLALLPSAPPTARRAWSDGRFYLGSLYTVPALATPLLGLVLEAGQGVNTLEVHSETTTLARLQQEVAPLLQQHAGKVHTLCFEVWHDVQGAWCAGLLGVVPLCVTHVRAKVCNQFVSTALAGLVRGGAASLRHPLTLALLHEGHISAGLEAELRQLAAGGGVGHGQPESLLTLEVVRGG